MLTREFRNLFNSILLCTIATLFLQFGGQSFAADENKPNEVGSKAKILTDQIAQKKDVIEPARFSPPTTHDSFWFQGQGAVPYYINNSTKGFLFTRWENGMTPAGGAIAAFQGWIFLQPEGRAEIIFQKYVYKLGRQTLAEAYGVKFPNQYDTESRSFGAKWSISGNSLTVKMTGTNPDPAYFDQQGDSVSFDLSKRETEVEKAARLKEAEKKRRASLPESELRAERQKDPQLGTLTAVTKTYLRMNLSSIQEKQVWANYAKGAEEIESLPQEPEDVRKKQASEIMMKVLRANKEILNEEQRAQLAAKGAKKSK